LDQAAGRKQWFNSELFVKMLRMAWDEAPQGLSNGQRTLIGEFCLDAEQKILYRGGEVVQVGPKVVETLAVLAENSGQVVSREQLLHAVWGGAMVEESSLTHNISVLRKILKNDPNCPNIETVPRRGYRLCLPAQNVLAASNEASLPGIPSIAEPIRQTTRSWHKPVAIFAVLSLLCAGAIMWATHRFGQHDRHRRSVAVIGFANLSRQADSAWLSSALSEMTATELGVGGELLTVPDENVARARTELKLQDQDGFSKETLMRLWRNLHADVVVSGAYTVLPPNMSGNTATAADPPQVRVDVRVQDARSGDLVDSVSETGTQSDLFEMVSRAGARVRRDLGVEAAPQQMMEARTLLPSNPEAVRLYAEGATRLHSFDALGAKTWLLEAIQADRNYAQAHATLAEAFGVLGYETEARYEARIAFELASNLPPEARLAIEGRYRFTTKDWAGAVRTYRTLHTLAPDNPDYGLWLASSQTAASNGRAALETLAALRRMPPPAGKDPRIGLKEYEAWKSLGDFAHMESALADAADAAKEQGALLLLARARSRQCWVERVRAKTTQALDHCREAREIYAAAGDHRGEAESLRFLADIVSASDIKTAISEYRRALALEHEIGHLGGEATVITQLGTLYSNQGEHEIAQKSFEQAMKIFEQQGETGSATGLSVDLAGELIAQGRLADGDKIYRQALDSAVRIHDRYIQAIVQYNLGFDQELEGDLNGAAASYRQALTSFQDAGDKEHDVSVTKNLGEVAMLQGDVATARGYFQQAMNLPQASQDKLQAAEAEMDLDLLALDEGQAASQLEPSIRRIADVFRQGEDERFDNALDDQALSLALLSRCLLSEQELVAAHRYVHQAVSVAVKAAPDVRLTVAVSSARIDFAGGNAKQKSRALFDLESVIREAQRFHYPVVELEAQLALGELEVQSGALARGRARLQTVAAEASRRHYLLIARKAGPSA
jgi:eukaryotic-like serine/threonine-protein kinase